MDLLNSTTSAPERQKHQHLIFEDRCAIKVFRKLGYSLRFIAAVLDCSPSTVMYELRRGTGTRNGSRGRFPEYSAKRGQQNYEINRSRCHRPHILSADNPFIEWMASKVRDDRWSIDACVGYAKKNGLFPCEQIPCTKTLYNELWNGNLPFSVFDVPEALGRSHKKNRVRQNRRNFGRSIDERPEIAESRVEIGHWEIDTVVGHRAGRESVVLTLAEKATSYYIALKIPEKNPESVRAALEVLREEFGTEKFAEVFKTITADNGSEFSELSEIEAWGTSVYFAHPYSSWERPQNERQNRIFRRYVAKGKSIENYSAEQILSFADEMNALPRKSLGYCTPEELFDAFLDQVYSADRASVAM